MNTRRSKTAIDYIIIGLNPTLIVLMIASLVYFLTLCFYHGRHVNQINWILLLFTVAAVGIARIAIEQGREHATIFAIALGGATVVSTARFVGEGMPMVIVLLILIWYLADRITIDCTLIDEQQDASGEGLLQGGLFGAAKQSGAVDVSLDGTTGVDATPAQKRTHRPGIWILYLALAAIPLYGLGQLLLPDSDVAHRRALVSLAVYLASSLLLLVTTSFLGMRRYLRQRGVDMPVGISINWLGLGAVLVTGLLAICFFLPLPGQMLASIDGVSITLSDDLKASRWGWGDDGVDSDQEDVAEASDGEDTSRSKRPGGKKPSQEQGSEGTAPGGKKGDQGQGSGKQSEKGKSSGGDQKGEGKGQSKEKGDKAQKKSDTGEPKPGEKPQKDGGGKKDEPQDETTSDSKQSADDGDNDDQERSSEEQSAEQQSAEQQSADKEGGSASESPPPPVSEPWQMPDIFSKLGSLMKYLVFAGLAGVVFYYAMSHWDQLMRWWREFLGTWNRPEQPSTETVTDTSDEPMPQRPFSSYRNPLDDSSISMNQVVVTTFAALGAWARENDCGRQADTTPSEFSQQLAREYPENADEICATCELYNDSVYGGAAIPNSRRKVLVDLWSFMLQPRPEPNVAQVATGEAPSESPKWKY